MAIPERKLGLEQIVALAALAVIAGGCFLVMRPFLSALLWALIFAAALGRPFERLAVAIGRTRAALLLSLGSALLTLLPLGLLALRGAGELAALEVQLGRLRAQGLPGPPGWLTGLPVVGGMIGETWSSAGADLGTLAAALRPYFGHVAQVGLSVVLSFANAILELLVALLIAFFLFRDGQELADALARGIRRLTPRGDALIALAAGTVRSVVLGIVGTAICQGVLAAIGLAIAGVPAPVLLGFLTALGSPFPVLPVLPWLGGVIWLLSEGETPSAIFLALWGALGVSSADNFVRPWLISLGSPLPMLLILLGVLGGVVAFGFLGLFLGPTLLALGHALILEWVSAERTAVQRAPR